MVRSRWLWLVVLWAASACTQEPAPLLKVGVNQWAGYEPLFLARQLGHYQNASVKLVELPSNTESIHLLREGRLDAAALTLDEVLSVMDQGTPLSIVTVFDFSNGADVLLGKKGISELEAIRGYRVGVESSGVGAVLLHAALSHAGLEESDVRMIYLTADEHERAFVQGKVDALVTFEPVKSKLLSQGAHVLFDSSQVPELIVDVLAVRTDRLPLQSGQLLALLQGYYQALRYMGQHPAQAMRM